MLYIDIKFETNKSRTQKYLWTYPTTRVSCATYLSLHTEPDPPASTDLLYTALFTTKKTPISQIPERTERSLARGKPKMADGFHFDRRLPRPPIVQSLSDTASSHYNSLYKHTAHEFRLKFPVLYNGGDARTFQLLFQLSYWYRLKCRRK